MVFEVFGRRDGAACREPAQAISGACRAATRGIDCPAVPDVRIKVATSLNAVPAHAWNACANPAPSAPPRLADGRDRPETHNPFISHAFLSALEDSGSRRRPHRLDAGAHSGRGRARTAWSAAAPCYLKSHSQGEYVFDHGWADAYERAGGRYYPKLQVSVPFTPVTGPRLLVATGRATGRAVERALIAGAAGVARPRRGRPRSTLTFLPHGDARTARAGRASCCAPTSSSTGSTRAMATSTIFSRALASRKRKAIRRERRDALAHGVIDRAG